jgi:hypothetical protein
MKKHKEVSRELSNYIMYLVFKCGVMLTSRAQFVHDEVHCEIRDALSDQQPQQGNLYEKDAVMKLFIKAKEEERTDSKVEIQKHKETADNVNADGSHMQKLLQSTRESIYSPVLPRACEVAHELVSINDETHRWGLIAKVWLEMLYYTAPRCGGAFHYKHLSTGGELITHVLFLMYSLGPFLPNPGA